MTRTKITTNNNITMKRTSIPTNSFYLDEYGILNFVTNDGKHFYIANNKIVERGDNEQLEKDGLNYDTCFMLNDVEILVS